jgi:hypothetical protein
MTGPHIAVERDASQAGFVRPLLISHLQVGPLARHSDTRVNIHALYLYVLLHRARQKVRECVSV